MKNVLYKWNPYPHNVICEMMDNKNLQTSLCQTKNMPAHFQHSHTHWHTHTDT